VGIVSILETKYVRGGRTQKQWVAELGWPVAGLVPRGIVVQVVVASILLAVPVTATVVAVAVAAAAAVVVVDGAPSLVVVLPTPPTATFQSTCYPRMA
jgi:hypothetical protein